MTIDTSENVFISSLNTKKLVMINTKTNGISNVTDISGGTVFINIHPTNNTIYACDYMKSTVETITNPGGTKTTILTKKTPTDYGIQVSEIDTFGNLFVGTYINPTRVLMYVSGTEYVIAGGGTIGYIDSTNETSANSLNLSAVSGLQINKGRLYVVVQGSVFYLSMQQIYDNYLSTLSNIKINKFAGTGVIASSGPIPKDSLAINITLNAPRNLAFDNNGNVYIADWLSGTVKKVNSLGFITNLFGVSSSSPTISYPVSSLAVVGLCINNKTNKIYAADYNNSTVIELS